MFADGSAEAGIRERILAWNKTFIMFKDLVSISTVGDEGPLSYPRLSALIVKLIESGVLKGASKKMNGRYPPLPEKFRILRDRADEDVALRDFERSCYPGISLAFYRGRPEEFSADRDTILALSDWFFRKGRLTATRGISLNERSWEIFMDEKFLASSAASGLMRRLGLSLSKDLRCFNTYEPFFYTIYEAPGAVRSALIVENKDTWSTIRMLCESGTREFFGLPIDLLIYGEGNKVLRSFEFTFTLGLGPGVNFAYFGDLDPSGVDIAFNLAQAFRDRCIIPAKAFYERLALENEQRIRPLRTKQRCSDEALSWFLRHFDGKPGRIIEDTLRGGSYIPQEGMSAEHFIQGAKL